jgi:predicted metal-dependent enzyme (double-stranded beta helix superfamily)
MFDLDRFAEDCRAALAQDRGGQRALREVVARAVSDPGAVLAALGEPRRGAVAKLHHAPDLTVLNVVWGPRMTIHPHDHRMAAVIGVYAGRRTTFSGGARRGAGWRPRARGRCARATAPCSGRTSSTRSPTRSRV